MRASTALAALHVAVALFGFAALFGAFVALPPVAIVFGRTVVAAAALALVLAQRQQAAGRATPALAVNGALLALHWVTFFAAVQAADVATALLGFASFPVFVLLLEALSGARRPDAVQYATVVAVVAGLALLVRDFSWSSSAAQGLAYGVAAGFTFALLTLRNRARVARVGAVALALWQNVFAAAWLVPFVVLAGRAAVPTMRDVALIGLLGVFCTAVAHTLFIASMRRVSAHAASVVSLLEPVYGIALAALVLGQWPDLRTLCGGVLVIGAAAVATRRAAGLAPRAPIG
jgi:drug/metabolite transporter (DMT)-like permease